MYSTVTIVNNIVLYIFKLIREILKKIFFIIKNNLPLIGSSILWTHHLICMYKASAFSGIAKIGTMEIPIFQALILNLISPHACFMCAHI